MVRDARDLARRLLREHRPERWLRTQGGVDRAAELAGTVGRKIDNNLDGACCDTRMISIHCVSVG